MNPGKSDILISLVWIINGAFCKVLEMVPRHKEIVSAILGEAYARQITIGIGIAETVLAIWILLGYFRKSTAVFQVSIILTMNIIEMIVVPDKLLWGPWNLFFALLFSGFVIFNGFRKRIARS